MSKFKRLEPPSERVCIWEFKADNISIVALAFAFGQYRLQVWYSGPNYVYPEVVTPDF